MDKEKTVLVAGTFDILHESHVNMLRNAKNLGSKLIVMLSTDEFNDEKGMIRESMFWNPFVMSI